MSEITEQVELEVEAEHQVGNARRAVSALAVRLGFSKTQLAELQIVATELAGNLARHARQGRIRCREVRRGTDCGLEIIAEDTGPGIADFREALRDGFSTDYSMGGGLGAVKRLADEFDLHSKTEKSTRNPREGIGTVITVRKWVRNPGGAGEGPAFRYSAFCRPCRGESVCGDAFFVRERGRLLFAAVIDGLGHGPEAGKAAARLVKYLETNHRDPLDRIMAGGHEELRGERGAVMSLALLDAERRKLVHCGVGNIRTRVFGSPVRVNPVAHGGVLGSNIGRIAVEEYTWVKGSTLVMASDGISDRWDLADYPGLADRDPAVIADTLLRDYGRADDDATVLVIR